jgi:APA family basic amino acid/polyamine antiporter
VPALSIAACAYLMVNLSPATKTIFTIWMVVAVITYFFYGIHNSRLKKA